MKKDIAAVFEASGWYIRELKLRRKQCAIHRDHLKNKCENLFHILGKSENKVQELEKKLKEADQVLHDYAFKNDQLRRECKDLRDENGKLKVNSDILKGHHQNACELCGDQQVEISKLKIKIHTLEEELKANKGVKK